VAAKRSFDTDKTLSYWKQGAEYDMATAFDMLKVGRYPYALFMAHMALEKMIKALYVKRTGHHAPRTHSLTMLSRRLKSEIPKDILEELASYAGFHVQTRYPDYLFEYYDFCTPEYTRKTLAQMNEVFEWLKRKLPN
jgi:HEPN domain-containing protein